MDQLSRPISRPGKGIRRGYRVLTACDETKAWEIVAGSEYPIDLVTTEVGIVVGNPE